MKKIDIVGVMKLCHKIERIQLRWHTYHNSLKGKVGVVSLKLLHSRSYLLGFIIPISQKLSSLSLKTSSVRYYKSVGLCMFQERIFKGHNLTTNFTFVKFIFLVHMITFVTFISLTHANIFSFKSIGMCYYIH